MSHTPLFVDKYQISLLKNMCDSPPKKMFWLDKDDQQNPPSLEGENHKHNNALISQI